MPPPANPLATRQRLLAVWGLAWIAGFVDGAGYLALVGVYTSHMTGNTAALGRFLSAKDWREVAAHGWPLVAFLAGLMVGATLMEIGRRGRHHSRLSLVLGVEIVLLALLAALDPRGSAATLGWLWLPAAAMGMQTVTITKIGDQRVYSTYMTGSLSKFAEAVTGYGFWLADRIRSGRPGWPREALRHNLLGHTIVTGGLWLLFLIGGFSGAVAESAWGLHALWWPVLGLGLLAWLDRLHPISPVHAGEKLGFEG
jgi:uncharacterized membrane protein YoaK (UPF0700 family)